MRRRSVIARVSRRRYTALSCRVVSTCAEFVQASPREFNAASRLSSFLSRDCVAVHRTNVVAFALRRMTMRRRPIRAPRTHALPPYDTHFVHLSCLPRTAASTKRVRARPYSRHGACATCVNARARARACTRGDATSLSNCLETRADPLSPAFNRSQIFLPPPHGFSFLLFIVNSPTSPITYLHSSIFQPCYRVFHFFYSQRLISIKKEIIFLPTCVPFDRENSRIRASQD